MNAQCNAFYGTALYQRECLTTLKSSEGNSLPATFLYRNVAFHAARFNDYITDLFLIYISEGWEWE